MAGSSPDVVAQLQDWMTRHQIFANLSKIQAEMVKLEQERQKSPRLLKFMVEYNRRMPKMQALLDLPPASDAARKAHDNLLNMLWRGKDPSGEDQAYAAARVQDYDNAEARLKKGWDIAKELQREQAQVSQEPSTMATIGTALKDSALDMDKLVIMAQLAVDIAKSFVSLPDALRNLNKLLAQAGVPVIAPEFVALEETMEDCYNGVKALGWITRAAAVTAETGIGPLASAVLSVGIIAGMLAEVIATLLDLIAWVESWDLTRDHAKVSTDEVKKVVSYAKSIADGVQTLLSKTGPLIEFGRGVRKLMKAVRSP